MPIIPYGEVTRCRRPTGKRGNPSVTRAKSACQVSLMKGNERFIVRCGTGDEEAAIGQLMHWAEDPDLDFDWFDAAVLSRQITQQLIGRSAKGGDATEDETPNDG
jgi:predicted nucleotidyltransferase component of viral defense system